MITSPILLSDAPVDPTGDLIWHDTDMGMDIAMISEAILKSEEPLVFAVHGPWGSGKTSFLKMIEGELVKQKEEKVYICWYIASNYQAVSDVSTTLTLRILRTLSETSGDTSAAEKIYDTLLKPSFELKEEVTGAYGFLEELAGKVAVLADLGVVIEDFLKGGMGGGKSKLVLMVDDLDRCSLDFIGDLVETIQRLSSVKNLFILMAVDQARLQNALEKRFEDVNVERGPRWAGEKYIQHAIELPPLNEQNLENFIYQSLVPNSLDEEDIADDPALETIIDSTDYFKVAVRHKMPRTIKACINLIRPTLTREIVKNPTLSEDDKRIIIKRRLIAYLFRDFRINWLSKAEADRNSTEFRFLTELEKLCRSFYSGEGTSTDTYALFKFSVDRLKAANLLENRTIDIPEELAKLLARSPFFAYKEIGETLIRDVGVEARLEELYNESEEGRQTENARQCVLAAAEAYKLVRDNRRVLGNVAWMTNNLALNAEDFREYGLAEALYRLTLEIDPTYVRTMVNFAAFILNNRPDMYEEARSWLNTVVTRYSEHAQYPKALTRLVQLKNRLGEPIDQEMEQLARMAQETTDRNSLNEIFRAMIDANREMQAIELFKTIASRIAGTEALAAIQFDLATNFVGPETDECDFLALDLYKQLLDVPELLTPDVFAIAKTGYAYLLQKQDYDAVAGPIFYDAYMQMPDESVIRDFYSKYLVKIGQVDSADKVLDGEPLSEADVQFEEPTEELPERFSAADLPNFLQKPGGAAQPDVELRDQPQDDEDKTFRLLDEATREQRE